MTHIADEKLTKHWADAAAEDRLDSERRPFTQPGS